MREILYRGKGDTRFNSGDWYYGVPLKTMMVTGKSARIAQKEPFSPKQSANTQA